MIPNPQAPEFRGASLGVLQDAPAGRFLNFCLFAPSSCCATSLCVHTHPHFLTQGQQCAGGPSADRLIRSVLQHGLRRGARLACVIGLQASTGTAAQRQPPAVPRRCYHRCLPCRRCMQGC